MRILFIGTVDFSYAALKTLIDTKSEVVGVVTKSVSKFNSDYKDLTKLCNENFIPFFLYNKDNITDYKTFIFNKKPDIIYCFGWSHILEKEVFNFPKYGAVGFHPAELPNNRGRHPIIWALALGLKKTASTFFFINEGADTGDIISQETILIDADFTSKKLYQKIIDVALEQIRSFTNDLKEKKGRISREKQNLEDGNYWRKRGKKDGLIDFRMSSEAIYNLIRALTHPYIGAHIVHENEDVIIWDAEIVDCDLKNIEPGKVLQVSENRIKVKTSDKAILLTNYEFKNLPKEGEYL